MGNKSGMLPSLGLSVADNFMQNAFTNLSNSINAKRNFKMWQAMNEYNKPINQIARLKEAGLNPNLAYNSSGAANAGNATSSANAGNQAGYVSPLNKVIDKLSAFAQLKSLMLDNENKKKQGKTIDLENLLKEQEYNQRGKVNPLNVSALNVQIGNMQLQNEAQTIANEVAKGSKQYDMMLREYAGKNAKKTWDLLEEKWKYQINLVAMQVQQFKNLKKQYDLMAAQEKDFFASAQYKASATMLNFKIARCKDLEYKIMKKADVPEADFRGLMAGINKTIAEYAVSRGYFTDERDYQYYQNRYHGASANAERAYLGYGLFMRGLQDATGVIGGLSGLGKSHSPIINYNTGYGYNTGIIGR